MLNNKYPCLRMKAGVLMMKLGVGWGEGRCLSQRKPIIKGTYILNAMFSGSLISYDVLICQSYLRVLCVCSVDTGLWHVVRCRRGLNVCGADTSEQVGCRSTPSPAARGAGRNLIPLQSSHVSVSLFRINLNLALQYGAISLAYIYNAIAFPFNLLNK